MKTVSGVLHMTKTEKKNIELLLEHVKRDISYLGGGTYSTMKEDVYGGYIADYKAIKKAEEAIQDIEWIISIAVIK